MRDSISTTDEHWVNDWYYNFGEKKSLNRFDLQKVDRASPSQCWRAWRFLQWGQRCPAVQQNPEPEDSWVPRQCQKRWGFERSSRWAPGGLEECPLPSRCYEMPERNDTTSINNENIILKTMSISWRLRTGLDFILPCMWCSGSFHPQRHWEQETAGGQVMQPEQNRQFQNLISNHWVRYIFHF